MIKMDRREFLKFLVAGAVTAAGTRIPASIGDALVSPALEGMSFSLQRFDFGHQVGLEARIGDLAYGVRTTAVPGWEEEDYLRALRPTLIDIVQQHFT
jgi:hypothetical protein